MSDMTINCDQYLSEQNHNGNQVKCRIVSNFKIIKCFILVMNLKIKASAFVFAIIIYEKVKEFIRCRPGGELKLNQRPSPSA